MKNLKDTIKAYYYGWLFRRQEKRRKEEQEAMYEGYKR